MSRVYCLCKTVRIKVKKTSSSSSEYFSELTVISDGQSDKVICSVRSVFDNISPIYIYK